jgi:hypothetical protein
LRFSITQLSARDLFITALQDAYNLLNLKHPFWNSLIENCIAKFDLVAAVIILYCLWLCSTFVRFSRSRKAEMQVAVIQLLQGIFNAEAFKDRSEIVVMKIFMNFLSLKPQEAVKGLMIGRWGIYSTSKCTLKLQKVIKHSWNFS